jgi:hypothetical protein
MSYCIQNCGGSFAENHLIKQSNMKKIIEAKSKEKDKNKHQKK